MYIDNQVDTKWYQNLQYSCSRWMIDIQNQFYFSNKIAYSSERSTIFLENQKILQWINLIEGKKDVIFSIGNESYLSNESIYLYC